MAELMDMPIEIVVKMFSLLDHGHAQNMRWSCKSLAMVYRDHRVMMRGPKIDASIHQFNNEMSILIKRCSEEHEWKAVPIADWDIYFRNAEVNELAIRTDSIPPMDLYDRMLFCKSIEKIEYYGDYINQEWLDSLNQLTRDTFNVGVTNWPENLIGSTKIKLLLIQAPISNFDKILNAINTTPGFAWTMEMPVFETAIEILRTVQTGQIEIKFWCVSNDNRAYTRSNRNVLEFVHQVQRISKKPLETIIHEDYIKFVHTVASKS